MSEPVIQEIITESDIVMARSHGRDIARRMGFGVVDQTRIATAISELARNILQYAERGSVTITVMAEEDRQGLEIIALDQGPGIETIGQRTSGRRGLGLGLSGTKNLMDDFDLVSEPGQGTRIRCVKWL